MALFKSRSYCEDQLPVNEKSVSMTQSCQCVHVSAPPDTWRLWDDELVGLASSVQWKFSLMTVSHCGHAVQIKSWMLEGWTRVHLLYSHDSALHVIKALNAEKKLVLLHETCGGFVRSGGFFFFFCMLKALFWCSSGLDGAGYTSILHMATVGFAPARKLTLVDGVFSPCTSYIIHPDQTSTCAQRKMYHIMVWTV